MDKLKNDRRLPYILMDRLRNDHRLPYIMILGVFIIFTIFALLTQAPTEIFKGLIAINKTRGVLLTDYFEVVGIGAALMNGVIMGAIAVLFFLKMKVVPTGATIMAVFITVGFSLFGKNLLTMTPITFGVWLYTKALKKKFADYYVIALLAATLSPITSEIIFLQIYSLPVNIILGVLLGTSVGFLFPMVTDYVAKFHGGYNLYNMGFVGGILATPFVAVLKCLDIEVHTEYYVSSGNNGILSIFLYVISAFLILFGLIFGKRKQLGSDMLSVMKRSGRLPSDFYSDFGANICVNMGVLCAFGTSVVLVLGAELNGPVIAGILTLAGFGAYGKHLKNVVPLMVGAIIATYVNKLDPIHPTNVIAILFCTGLAPISGLYGVFWGVFTGFVHVCIAHHIGFLCSGLNLYSNGFAAGFVVFIVVPIIEGTKRIYAAIKYNQY